MKIDTIIFDGDGTLLEVENPYLVLAANLDCETVVREWVQEFLDKKISYEELQARQNNIFKDNYLIKFGRMPNAEDGLEKLLPKPLIRPGASELVGSLRDYHKQLFILSSGFKYILEHLTMLGFPKDNIFANAFIYDANNVSTNLRVHASKTKALDEIIANHQLEYQTCAYIGDNIWDKGAIDHILERGGYAFIYEDSHDSKIYEFGEMPDVKNFFRLNKLKDLLDYLD